MGHNHYKPREYPRPTEQQATEFALMLSAGLPPEEALPYFIDGELEPAEVEEMSSRWAGDRRVQGATLELQGKAWQDRTFEEKVEFALKKQYVEMAYFLYAHNYATLTSQEKTKADTCRTALEQKIAGTAGKLDPLSQFLDDMAQGKTNLPILQSIPTN